MRWILPFLVVAGCFTSSLVGCSSRFPRPSQSEPFAKPRRAPTNDQRDINDYPLLGSPGSATEVTQAGGDQVAKTPVLRGRGQPPRADSDSPMDEDDSVTITVHPDSKSPNPPPAAQPRPGQSMDHAPDYSWLQGKLEYSALGGGVWKVRYAPLSADDEHGGSVILESPPTAGQFRAGDTVYVQGRILQGEHRRTLHNPVYHVQKIRLVEE